MPGRVRTSVVYHSRVLYQQQGPPLSSYRYPRVPALARSFDCFRNVKVSDFHQPRRHRTFQPPDTLAGNLKALLQRHSSYLSSTPAPTLRYGISGPLHRPESFATRRWASGLNVSNGWLVQRKAICRVPPTLNCTVGPRWWPQYCHGGNQPPSDLRTPYLAESWNACLYL